MPKAPDAAPVTAEDQIVTDMFADLRGRKLLKWPFMDANDQQCGPSAYGYLDKPIDPEAQNEIATAWREIIRTRLAATSSDRARGGGSEVTQEDREAAAKVLRRPNCKEQAVAEMVVNGHFDDDYLVQLFRRHRQAAEQRALAAEKDAVDVGLIARDWIKRHGKELLLRRKAEEKAYVTEAALAASEQRVRALVETADYAIEQYKRLWKGQVVRDLAEAQGAYEAAKSALLPAAGGESGEG